MRESMRFGICLAGAMALVAVLSARTAARAETVTFSAAGRVTAAADGAPVPVGSAYALTFSFDRRPPPAAGAATWVYTREYDLVGYTTQLGAYESTGAGRITLVHRPYGRDRVIVRGDDGDLLLWLYGDSAASFLAGQVPSAAAAASAATPALSAKALSLASAVSVGPVSAPAPLVGTFDSSVGATGWVSSVTLAPAAAPASAVPLPSAACGGLALLGVIGAAKLRRRRRAGERPA